MRILADFQTDRGRVKPNNEDAGGVFFGGRLLVVADGMGGGQAGEYAAQQAVNQVREVIAQAKYYTDGVGLRIEGAGRAVGAKGLELALQHANTFLYSMSRTQASLQGMGTTAVCCLIENGRAYFANIGDSRGYLMRRGQLKQVTRDHSLFSDPKGARTNIITRALGRKSYAEVEIFEEPLQAGDAVLLCTDGLSKVMPAEAISGALTGADLLPGLVAAGLIRKALEAGGPDNVTVAYARVEGPLDESCSGAWQPPADPDEAEEATALARAVPEKPRDSGREVHRGGAEGRIRPRRPAGRWALGAAAAVAIAAICAVAFLSARARPVAGRQRLVVEVHRLRGETSGPVEIALLDGARQAMSMRVTDLAGGLQRLDVTSPAGLSDPVVGNPGDQLRVPLPASLATNLTVRVSGAGALADGSRELPLANAWDLRSDCYRLVIVSSQLAARWQAVWAPLLAGDQKQGEAEFSRLQASLASAADARAGQAWIDRIRGLLKKAEDLASSVDSGTVSVERFWQRYDELVRLAQAADGQRPVGAPGVEGPFKEGSLRPSGPRLAQAAASAQRLKEARAEVDGLSAKGGDALAGAIERYREVLRSGRFRASDADQALLDRLNARRETAPAGATPTGRPVANGGGPAPIRATESAGADAAKRVRALESLRTDLAELQRRHLRDVPENTDLARELHEARARCIAALGPIVARGGSKSAAEQAAGREAATQWLILETWLSHRMQSRLTRPDAAVLEFLGKLGQLGVDKKKLGDILQKYKEPS